MNGKHSRRLAAAIVVALAAAYGAQSVAESASDPSSIVVRYRYADLTSEDGVKSLYTRLQSAARRVCDVGLRQPLYQQEKVRRCANQSLGNAVAALGNPQVAELHARGRRSPAATRIAEVDR